MTISSAISTSLRRAFAPQGRLRASINLGNPILAGRDPRTHAPTGVSIDLSCALAERLSLELEWVVWDAAGKSVDAVVDPTGCGDAYRAGLLYGRTQGWSWQDSARLASVMGAFKVVSQGPQNHTPSRQAISDRLHSEFGLSLPT